MEKRLLLAIVLSLAVVTLYNLFFMPQQPPKPPQERVVSPAEIPSQMDSTDDTGRISETPDITAVPPDDGQPEPDGFSSLEADQRIIRIQTRAYEAEIDTRGAHIISWKLRNYMGSDDKPLEMISPENPTYFPGDILVGGSGVFNETVYAVDSDEDNIILTPSVPSKTLKFMARNAVGLEVTKEITFYAEKIFTDLYISMINRGTTAAGGIISIPLPDRLLVPAENHAANRFAISGPLVMTGGKRDRVKISKHSERWVFPEPVQWVSVVENFFFAGLVPAAQSGRGYIEPTEFKENNGKPTHASPGLLLGNGPLLPGERVHNLFHVILAPKKYQLLADQNIGIETIVDFGWIEILGKTFYKILITLNGIVNNFGLAIIILTIGIKILLLPLTHVHLNSMKKMQVVQPQIKEIQERFRKDRVKQQQLIAEVYRKHGVNPMMGCLPMLIQLPIFLALYQVLMNAIELRGSRFLWAGDLSQPDIPLVLIMGASMILQQKMTPTAGDPRQAKMMMMMPVIFTAMFWNFPSGLVLYWLMNNILTIVQQLVMNRKTNVDADDDTPKLKARAAKKLASIDSGDQ